MGFKPRLAVHERAAPIWAVPAYLPHVQPDLTDAAVDEAERRLGVKLPTAYLALLAVQNGGSVRKTLPDSLHSMIWGIGPNYPNIEDEPWYADDDYWQPDQPALLVPFDGDGHWYYCFDYRAHGPTAEPAVSFVDVELERERRIAPSFDAFLDQLEQDIGPGTLGVTDDSSARAVVEKLSSALGKTFNGPDADAHGYPEYHCWLSEDPPRSVWVSENRVPRGFVRPDHDRYDELRGRLPGTALRIPAHPEVNAIIECSDDAIHRVHAACAKAGLQTIPLSTAPPEHDPASRNANAGES